jgi:hypothetical protein
MCRQTLKVKLLGRFLHGGALGLVVVFFDTVAAAPA